MQSKGKSLELVISEYLWADLLRVHTELNSTHNSNLSEGPKSHPLFTQRLDDAKVLYEYQPYTGIVLVLMGQVRKRIECIVI